MWRDTFCIIFSLEKDEWLYHTHTYNQMMLGLFEDDALGVFVGICWASLHTLWCTKLRDASKRTPKNWHQLASQRDGHDGRFLVGKGKKWFVELRGKRKSMIWTLIYTLPKTNSQFAPENGQLAPKGKSSSKHQFSGATVSGRKPKQPPGMHKNLINNVINYQPQLFISGSVRLIWSLVNQWMKFGPQILGC